MPVITIEMWEGRTIEQKKRIADGITQVMVNATGARPESVWIVIKDIPKHNWAIGGKLCSEP